MQYWDDDFLDDDEPKRVVVVPQITSICQDSAYVRRKEEERRD